jgi:hypothetical protein
MSDFAFSKKERISVQDTMNMLSELKQVVLKVLGDLNPKMESRWYSKYGDLASAFAGICIMAN